MDLTQHLHVAMAALTAVDPAATAGALPTATHLPGGAAPHMEEVELMAQEAELMAQEVECMEEEAMGHRMVQEEGLMAQEEGRMAQEVGLMAQVLMVAQATALVYLSHLILCIRT